MTRGKTTAVKPTPALGEGKLAWVADYSHSAIPISEVERRVISTQIFNRLHNVLQNSTVYLTYPSNRCSRFSHSLGCMHLAGRLFRAGILNADPAIRDNFLDGIGRHLAETRRGKSFKDGVDRELPDELSRQVFELHCSDFESPFYAAALPGFINNEKRKVAFLFAFQTVRLAALLHDLGHPPFSHITERSLTSIFEDLDAREKRRKALTPRESKFLAILREAWGSKDRANQKLHEKLGLTLSENILKKLSREVEDRRAKVVMLLLKDLVLDTLNQRNPYLSALHGIVDGDLDADRLDYVPRDLAMSGIGGEALDYERLIGSYQLVLSTDRKTSSPKFKFMPSVRALSTIESFYRRRFKLYKYVVYHHRVSKTDGLLEEVVTKLARAHLSQPKRLTDRNGNKSVLLPDDISGLWTAFDSVDAPKEQIFRYIQWDDAWLITVLRRRYFELEQEKQDGRNEVANEPIEIQLEEILSNKKAYHSLIKRVDSFVEVDEAFLGALEPDIDWSRLEVLIQASTAKADFSAASLPVASSRMASQDGLKGEPKWKILFESLVEYYAAFQQRGIEAIREERKSRGFFLVALARTLKLLGMSRHGLPFADDALSHLIRDHHLNDAILIHRELKPGVSGSFQLATDNTWIPLASVSRLDEELRQEASLYPPFYVYVYRQEHRPQGRLTTDVLRLMRQELGCKLATAFSKLL